MRIGLALNCTVQPCIFHRKNYFYPDMPKAYQISQYDVPLNVDGWLDLPDGSRVGIERAHVEEDTGKSTHVGGADGTDPRQRRLADRLQPGRRPARRDRQPPGHPLGGAGPRTTSPSCGRSSWPSAPRDAKMEEGSMRVDANVSVRRPGRAARHALRDQEPQLRALARTGDRVRGPPPDRPDRVGLVGEPGDPPLGRERRAHAHAAIEGGRRRLPLLPGARSRAARPGRRVDRRGALRRCRELPAAATCRARGGDRVRRPTAKPSPSSSSAARTATCSPSPRPAATPRARSSTSRRGSPSRVPSQRCRPATSPRSPASRSTARSTATQAKAVLAELVANGGGDAAAIAKARGFEAMDTSALESLGRRGDQRQRRRVGQVPRRRGQGARRPRRRGDEGLAGARRRCCRHGLCSALSAGR